MQKETIKGEGEKAVYESSFILAPSLVEGQVSSFTGKFEDFLKKLDGEVISGEQAVLLDLAYPITKVTHTSRTTFKTGYFGWVKFEVEVTKLKEVEKFLKEENDIIRFLVTKTVRENTLLHGKMSLKKEKEEVVKMKKEEVAEIPPEELSTPEEIDKSIEDLVIE